MAQVAVFALDNPDEIAFGTAASIAEKSKVQPSTLVRFAKAIGYDGFSDLQMVFPRAPARTRLQLRGAAGAIAGSMGDNGVNQIFSGVIAAASASIDSMVSRVQAQQFEKAVKLLADAQTIGGCWRSAARFR